MIWCVSYNCNSVRNNSEAVKMLLDVNDIVLLQEIMLCKSDLPFLDLLNENFDNIACVSDREADGIIEGRPMRGVAIFWRKSLNCKITPIKVDDSLIGVRISNGSDDVVIFNVYLPCDKQTAEAMYDYRCSLGKLHCLITEQDVNKVIVTGDFNADPTKGRFWKELLSFIDNLSFLIPSAQLPQETFTYLCPAKNTTS